MKAMAAQAWSRRGCVAPSHRPVQAQGDRAVRPVGRELGDLGDRRRLGLRHGAPVAIEEARLDRRQRLHRRQATLLDQIEKGPGVRMEHSFPLVMTGQSWRLRASGGLRAK